ncbi:MAG: DUF2752 domain-containing protein [Bacteroidaceae bacterium]|nr:DUF2752 domain-containing protein [Bacteroidaceae bacterium]
MRQRNSESTDNARHSHRIAPALFLIVLIVVFALAVMIGNPYSEAWFLKCPLYFLTGWQCPLCGAQRQLHSLMHLDIAGAWRMNAGLMLIYPYLAALLLCQFSWSFRHSKIGRFVRQNRTIFIFVALMLVWGVVRNVF